MKISTLNKKGFTIVELLIVIVIIGILATIGFVAFSGAQNKAKKSNAQTTASQVKSKLGEYNVDNSSYPADKDEVVDFLRSAEGGNNNSLADKLETGDTAAISYACDPDCDTGFVLTVPASIWNGPSSEDFELTN